MPKVKIISRVFFFIFLASIFLLFFTGDYTKAQTPTQTPTPTTGVCPNLPQGSTCCYQQKDFDGITRCYAGTGSSGFGTSPCYYTTGPILCPGQAIITPLPTGCQNRTFNECEQGNATTCLNSSKCPNGNCFHHMVTVQENNTCNYTCLSDMGLCPQYVTPSPSATPSGTLTPTATPSGTLTPTATPSGTTSTSFNATLNAVSQTGAQVFLADNVLGIQSVLITGPVTYDPVTQNFSNPNFNIRQLPPGTYQFFLHVDGYLNKQLTNNNGNLFIITPGQTTFSMGPVALMAGDIAPFPHGDNTINILDYNAVLSCLGLKASSAPTPTCPSPKLADVNKDGTVDKIDLDYISMYFGQKGDAPSGTVNNQLYTCATDPNCPTNTKTLQMCPLKCTKQ